TITGNKQLKDLAIRDKDEDALVNIRFNLSLVSGENAGSIVNIRRASDGSGNYLPHDVDNQLSAIRLMIREKKKLGTPGYGYTTTSDD
ncbi:MAG TPA: hypothetical protein VJZ27_20370, partial [Aggregatilineales bacterium]|nr:hypothetical protein [Aggregatilineales bacterium]